jgi:hypothetical protein
MSPERSDLVLAADIPDVELGVLVCDGLDVEADGGNGRDVLVELELVEDGWSPAVSDCTREPYMTIPFAISTYSSCRQRQAPASAVSSPWIRRSCSSFSIFARPL